MKEDNFSPGFPGKLIPTTFEEGNGTHSRTVKGLAFVPADLPPALDWDPIVGRLYPVLDQAKTSLLRLEGLLEAIPSKTILLSAMLTREAQASSKIENTFASLREIAIAMTDESKSDSTHMEVVRNRRAIEHAVNSKLPISLRLVREVHAILVTEHKDTPGKFRASQVCIGDDQKGFVQARFVPPPASELEGCLRSWERFCNRAGTAGGPELPGLVELALAHYQFETIHPFRDGNGRVGRALVNVGAIKNNTVRYPVCNLSEWVHSHRRDYYDKLLAVSTHGDWEGWIRFFCTALAEQASLDLQRANRLSRLYDKYRSSVISKGKSSLLIRLIDFLFEYQALTIPGVASWLDISYTAAQRHVESLVKKGLIEQVGKSRYDKLYIAPKIMLAIRGQGED